MIAVGLHGANGHQIHDRLVGHPLARLAAVSCFPEARLPENAEGLVRCSSLEELLSLPEITAVSLCSPRRADQARDAIAALRAGKHVLAEKPCAASEADLDAILQTSRETGRFFHEMAGTAFSQPYFAMRQIVADGRIGDVIQVIAEKSYPYYDGRPQDEAMDGGLIGQNAIHALRFVEHVAGVPITSIQAVETGAGNPVSGGGLVMAASLLMTLENGGVASISANYLNPSGTGVWSYESLRILGSEGMVESLAGGRHTRLVIGDRGCGPLDVSESGPDWLDHFFQEIAGTAVFPLPLERELSPTRWAIRAKHSIGIGRSVTSSRGQ
ncbi:MAG: Gfo/Idh/MocA family oxidoreductase [Chthoniobacterales bacterium]|nr:Gfo/Idh/MocA family oxidoreductase [Chthoniobacterales bacterium]